MQPAQTPQAAAPDDPPTYAQTLDATPPTTARRGRFLRYQPWIDKRAQERRDERDALRAAGLLQPSSWDIDSGDGEGTAEPHLARAASARERDELAEQRLAGASGALNEPSSTRKRGDSGASLASLGRDAVQTLSTSTFLQRVGARFSRGLPDKPLCACAVPERMEEEGDERCVLSASLVLTWERELTCRHDSLALIGTAAGVSFEQLTSDT